MEHEEAFPISLYLSPFLTPEPSLTNVSSPSLLSANLLTLSGLDLKKAQESPGEPVFLLSAGGGSQAHPCGLRAEDPTGVTIHYYLSGEQEGQREEPTGVFPPVFSLFHFTTLPPPRHSQGGDPGANVLRNHPGQGAEPVRGRWRKGLTRCGLRGTLC